MIKVAVLDDYQNAFQQIVDEEKYKDKFEYQILHRAIWNELLRKLQIRFQMF